MKIADTLRPLAALAAALILGGLPLDARAQDAAPTPLPEIGYDAELVRFPGAYAFDLPAEDVILVSDQDLIDLSDPDKVLNLALTHDERKQSLRQICEQGKARGSRRLIVAFDYFFKQYRPGQDAPRRLTCDMDEFIQRIAAIAKFAEGYGLGLEISLLSPLEIGPAFQKATGESGVWMQYRKGLRDPATGDYDVQLWRHKRWANNKGPIDVADAGVRVFAFKESSIGGTPYRVVDPASIREITATAQAEEWPTERKSGDFTARRVRVHGSGGDAPGLDRVLVVQSYRTPEMDYFSPAARAFLHSLVDKYADAGVKLEGLYSDEMHIQQDWAYFSHHDNGEFALRYVSDGLRKAFAEKCGAQYDDFAKYLVYFAHGQEDAASDLTAKQEIMHVMAPGPEGIQATALFRSRYFRLLQDGVVDLLAEAKRHAETRMGRRLMSRAHATWAQSPTIDKWDVGRLPAASRQYEYTSNFVWSCTVHQASSACHDYFKWGDYLTGNGTDHSEGGWLDRDYYALALAASLGVLNEVPNAYAAHWGSPGPVGQRYADAASVYGDSGSPLAAIVEEKQHREVDVLMLYPLDLVAADERFGSWMTQYGYANYITQGKLLERGAVRDGAIEAAGRRYTTLAALFEPFPSKKLLEMCEALAAQGGRVVWSGPAPLLDADGDRTRERWAALMGVAPDSPPEYEFDGLRAPGLQINFEGALASVPPQTVLTDLTPDRLYPFTPAEGTEVAARAMTHVVGSVRRTPAGGALVRLAFRPRDDQSQSLGYETRTWFEALNAIGAYPGSGKFAANDNPQVVSRTTDYLACKFPNGAVAIAPHFRSIVEGWGGGFGRDAETDKAYMEAHPIPPSAIHLDDFKVAGHRVEYDGGGFVVFRPGADGRLEAFAGTGGRSIRLDGAAYDLADAGIGGLAFAPLAQARRVAGGAVMIAIAYGSGELRIPCAGIDPGARVIAQGATPGSAGAAVPSTVEPGLLRIALPPEASGRWLYILPAK